MSTDSMQREQESATSGAGALGMKLEIAVVPVSDVDRAKAFYSGLGWRLDVDFKGEDGYRVIQFTPPESACSVMFGQNMTDAAPGSARGHYLVVTDIAATRAELERRGVEVGPLFHDEGGVFHRNDGTGCIAGASPERKSYATFATFSDPDGNRWFLQEITARLSADVEADDPRFTPQILAVLHGKA
ncbi:VOC family protein [Caballeronia sp. LZ043]|uniref:VOC family protein n=1 Tax=Caballeronia sp. LZ043 TaxID=3038569 RepID=UPI00285944E3|nr:VOC family protein [Caballeronia sp. LZ043]MDR5824169.1 VOC family protein [Caballeronia sp. LZ043]